MPRAIGQATTSSTTRVPLYGTNYVEQTSGARRSLKSSSAADAAAGTGARQVKIIYYALASDGTITGPFAETVTLNGVTAVPTVADNIALIERIEVAVAGSGRKAAGIISLYDDALGAGSVFASIAMSDVQTRYAHHYVPSNRACDMESFILTGGAAAVALIDTTSARFPNQNVELPVTNKMPVSANIPLPIGPTFPGAAHSLIPGPARVRMYVTPGDNSPQTNYGQFDFTDRQSQAF